MPREKVGRARVAFGDLFLADNTSFCLGLSGF